MVLPGVSPAGGRTSLSELAEVCPCNSVFGLGMGAGGPASTGVPTCPVLRASGGGSEQPGERRAWNEQRDALSLGLCPFVEAAVTGYHKLLGRKAELSLGDARGQGVSRTGPPLQAAPRPRSRLRAAPRRVRSRSRGSSFPGPAPPVRARLN